MKSLLYDFRMLDFTGLLQLIEWARVEGWNPGLHDADVFWATDNKAFYGAYADGKLIGGGSLVSYNGDFGFMGFFIIKPEYRMHGIGRQLWYFRRNVLLSRLKPGVAIGMDGVLSMQDFYKQGGFQIAFRDERYELRSADFKISKNISLVDVSDFHTIHEYDKICFGFDRETFLKKWLFIPQTCAFKYSEDNKLKGFVVMRKASVGYKIGPLFADTFQVASELLKTCLTAVSGERIFIDIPVVNSAAMELVRKYHAGYVFECARMYYGPAPEIPLAKIFGITSFELG